MDCVLDQGGQVQTLYSPFRAVLYQGGQVRKPLILLEKLRTRPLWRCLTGKHFILSYRDFWENIIAYITSSAWENIPDNILGTYPPSKEELENFKRKRRETKMDIAQLIVEAPSAHLITRPEPELLEHITFAAVIKELGIMFSEFKAKYCASDAYSQQMALDYIDSFTKENSDK